MFFAGSDEVIPEFYRFIPTLEYAFPSTNISSLNHFFLLGTFQMAYAMDVVSTI